jgi:hypothetical protein
MISVIRRLQFFTIKQITKPVQRNAATGCYKNIFIDKKLKTKIDDLPSSSKPTKRLKLKVLFRMFLTNK